VHSGTEFTRKLLGVKSLCDMHVIVHITQI